MRSGSSHFDAPSPTPTPEQEPDPILEVTDEVNEELVRDINERRAELKKERATLEDRLADLDDEVQQESNPDLLHRLPIGRINLAALPDKLTRQRLEIHYNHETRIATCRITLIGETVDAVANADRQASVIPSPTAPSTTRTTR